MRPEEVTWVLCKQAQNAATELAEALGEESYEQVKTSLKEFMCSYFTATTSCDAKQGKSISPVRCGVAGAKGLKVRFGFPGCGKSGGLRLAVLAYCAELKVKIAGAWLRKDDPDDADLAAAFESN